MPVPSEDPRQLRFAIARLRGCDADGFWMTREGRVLGDNMELPPDGGHVQVRMRGVGGMHPGFATPNEIEEAMREEEERKGMRGMAPHQSPRRRGATREKGKR